MCAAKSHFGNCSIVEGVSFGEFIVSGGQAHASALGAHEVGAPHVVCESNGLFFIARGGVLQSVKRAVFIVSEEHAFIFKVFVGGKVESEDEFFESSHLDDFNIKRIGTNFFLSFRF